jgi:hypothetical protein
MPPQFPLLFSPLRIGTAEVKNRIVSTSHDASFGAGGYLVGEAIDDTQKPVVLERLLRAGVTLTPLTEALAVGPGGVRVRHVLTGAAALLPADSVVVACGGRAEDGLYHALADWPGERMLVGDAFAPRRVHDALLDATRAARAL